MVRFSHAVGMASSSPGKTERMCGVRLTGGVVGAPADEEFLVAVVERSEIVVEAGEDEHADSEKEGVEKDVWVTVYIVAGTENSE